MTSGKYMESLVFGIADYLSLTLVLIISVMIGLYYSFNRKDNTIEEYLFGNRKLKIVPVALSLMATRVSSLTIISVPTEFYLYGSDFFYYLLSSIINDAIIYLLFLPFFLGMKISTLYEYLDKRFNGTVRTTCSVLFALNVVLQMPIILNATSLTISQVCGINYYASTIILGTITTFYTAIGGIKGVIWTDVLQALFMFFGVISLAVKGTIDAHGFHEVWKTNHDGGRIAPTEFSLDFTHHYSIWSWIFGAVLNWFVFCFFNQGCLQRFLSLPTVRDAKTCYLLSSVATVSFRTITIYIGMLIFTMVYDCDPLKNQEIKGRDQMVALYIMKTLQNIPGMPGLIISAIVSAALSTISTQLNSVAAIVLCDYYKPYINRNVSEKVSTIILKIVVVVLGIFVTGFTFIVRNFGTALQAVFAFSGTINGPVLGTFMIGMFIPTSKSKATFFGSLAGLALVAWISTGMNIAVSSGDFKYKTREIYTYGCENNFTTVNATRSQREVLKIYQISNLWYTTIGCLATLVVATVLNLFMERNDPRKMDRTLFSPIMHRFYPQKTQSVAENEMSLLNGETKMR